MPRRKLSYGLQAVYDGFLDQRPTDHGQTPFSYDTESAFFYGLNEGPLMGSGPITRWGDYEAEAAYWAGLDLRNTKRGLNDITTDSELLKAWCSWERGQYAVPDLIFGKNSIRTLSVGRTLAMRYDGTVYYEWGALPGYAFPDHCIAYKRTDSAAHRTKVWSQVARGLKALIDFEKASYQSRRHDFHTLLSHIQNDDVPADSLAARIFVYHGAMGLIRHYFKGRWSAALEGRRQLPKGMSHVRLKFGKGDHEIYLCDMEEAMHALMSADKTHWKLHDMNTPIPLPERHNV